MRLKSNDFERQTIVICSNSTQVTDRICYGRNWQKNFNMILHFLKEMDPLTAIINNRKLYKNGLVTDFSNPSTQTCRTK